MEYISVKSKLMNCRLDLERRVTYIMGDSGMGKSSFIDILSEYNKWNDGVVVDSSRKFEVSPRLDIDNLMQGFSGFILLYDDEYFTESEYINGSFLDKLIKYDIYLVIVNRVVGMSRVPFPVSLNSILTLEYIGNHKYRFTKIVEKGSSDGICVDCIISEDRNGSCQFIHSHYPKLKCMSTRGYGRVVSKLVEAIADEYKNILLLVDVANYGNDIMKLVAFCKQLKKEGKDDISIYIDTEYECFEYLLLNTKWFKGKFNFSLDDANKYKTWELYFEDYLERVSRGLPYSYKHGGRLKKCYLDNCENICTNMIAVNKGCAKYEEGNKLKILLDDTKFEYLSKLL